ncbi:tripartite motif-containing protein 3-like [Lingula anatina]|uniref:Tripartite motif-containing protein 3-like n=1 Tax=Lingula anatina TaxID=7574 RepID=A0A1S3JD52_LINAN|nr:tripartite motif-containing protein 3-like [Lingula anatina]|eukprot:XP_013408101.1 tripartite motif-containing protein 3-like [Lingula anatina]
MTYQAIKTRAMALAAVKSRRSDVWGTEHSFGWQIKGMASKELYDVFSENFLTCHLCLEEYKDPRVLPCYHTFCLECIADHAARNGVQNKFSCPVCRHEAPIPPGGLQTLVKNFFLKKVKEFMRGHTVPQGRLCEYCDHKEATLLCQGCPKTNLLCDTCRVIHDKIPALNGHQFVHLPTLDLSTTAAKIQAQLRQELDSIQHCEKQPSELLAFYRRKPSIYTKTPCRAKTKHTLQFPEIPEPRPLSNKTGPITAKTFQGPFDACFGSLKKARARHQELALHVYPKPTWLQKPRQVHCFSMKDYPWDITFAADGCMFVVHGATVAMFSNTGRCNREINIEGGARRITALSNDRFVVTCGDDCCRLYSTSGRVCQCFGQGDMWRPWGVTVDRTEGKVYVCDGGTKCICMYDMVSFILLNKIDIPMCRNVRLQCVYHHAISAVLVSDCRAHCVYAVTLQGDVIFEYGARGRSGSMEGQVSYPSGVCVDKFGHIFIADCFNGNVAVLDSDGKFVRNILTRQDGIMEPMIIAINNKGELVVGTNQCKILTFKYIT